MISKRQAGYSYKFQQVGRQSISHTHSCSNTDRHTPGDRRINTYRHTLGAEWLGLLVKCWAYLNKMCAGRCGPAAAHPYACDAKRALLPITVGAMNTNELLNLNDVRKSATIFPRLGKLTFDLLAVKVVSKSRLTWATSMPILVCLGLSVLVMRVCAGQLIEQIMI